MWKKSFGGARALRGGCAGVASCSQNGSYRLSWVFEDQATATAESTATGCGRYYVDSIMATGIDDAGDAQQIVALCTAGWVTADATPGTWSFSVQMLNSQGALIASGMPDKMKTSPQAIAADGPQTQFSVVLMLAPACSDGIDNDGDGRSTWPIRAATAIRTERTSETVPRADEATALKLIDA